MPRPQDPSAPARDAAPGAAPADLAAPRRSRRGKVRPAPGVYPHEERLRGGGGTVVRYRTHMGQLCTPDTTPAEAIAMWDRRQANRSRIKQIGPLNAAKLNALLKPADRDAYEQLVAGQTCDVEQLLDWLRGRGYFASFRTVQAHREHFLLELLDIRKSARLAVAFAETNRQAGAGTLADAAVGRTEQMFMEAMFEMKPPDRRDLKAKDWVELQKAVAGLVDARRAIEMMRADFEDRARRLAKELAAEEQSRSSPLNPGEAGQRVVNRVREILGIPLGDLTEEEDA